MRKHYPCLLEVSRYSFLVGTKNIQYYEISIHAQSIDGQAGKDYRTIKRRFYKHQEFRVRCESKKCFSDWLREHIEVEVPLPLFYR